MKDWVIGPDGWVSGKMFGYPVEKNEVKRPDGQAYLILDENSKLGNLHTSEGVDVDTLVAYLKTQGFAGQWCVGEGRIIQTRPLWAQGSLLLGGSAINHPMRMEVEQVAKSQYTPDTWLPAEPTFGPISALVAFYNVEFGIPLKTPVAGWRDDGADISPGFYGPNNRRTAAAGIGLANLEGWIHHCEVPLNLHADCGSYNRTALFAAAQKLVDSLNPPEDDLFTDADRSKLIEVRDNSLVLRRLADKLRAKGYDIAPTQPGEPWADNLAAAIATLFPDVPPEDVNPIADERNRAGVEL